MRKTPLEWHEQVALVTWCQLHAGQYPELGRFYHTANGEKRPKATAAKLKKMGVMPHIPDLCWYVARRGYHGLYIELKARDGKASGAQRLKLNEFLDEGYAALVARGWLEAAWYLCWYFDLPDTLAKELE